MKKRIIISVTSDLATDQRVLKTANSCHKNGYDVLLVGRKLKKSLPVNQLFATKRMRLFFNRSAFFYAEYNLRLFFKLLFSRADIFLSNDTDTLLANYFASKIRRKKLVFDAHELFPEVPELTNRPNIKRVWEKIEDWIFPKLENSYTVCQSIADYYKKKYGINMQVVRNTPYYQENTPKETKNTFGNKKIIPKKIILYQGALNIGRGIEWTIDAMPLIDNAILVIIGDGDIRAQLEAQVKDLNLSEKVIFLGKIPADELYKYTISANLGLCLLENRGLSYYFSLPNRIFDYIQARIPVLASDFPEISNIVKYYNTGKLIDNYTPEYLAETISEMLAQPIDTQHFDTISKELCWEKEEKILLEIIKKAE